MQNVLSNKLIFGVIALVSVVFPVIIGCQANYSKTVKEHFVGVLGEDFDEYEFYSFPRTGPTIGHIYMSDASAGPEVPAPGDKLQTKASNWLPDDTLDAESSAFFERVIDSNYGPKVSSVEDVQKIIGFDLKAPVKTAISELGISFEQMEKLTIQVDAKQYLFKEIMWGELYDRKDRLRPFVRRLISEELGDIVVINKVVIVDGYQSTVSIDSGVNPVISAKLASLDTESKFGFNWKKEFDGRYTAIASDPMVIGIQFAVPSPDPTRSSGQKLVPIKLSENQFQKFLENNPN